MPDFGCRVLGIGLEVGNQGKGLGSVILWGFQ